MSTKIYTKTGDKGTTALFGGTRVSKFHPRTNAYGTVDELNAHIGMIRSYDIAAYHKEMLIEIQGNLFTLGSELATDPEKATLKSGKQRLKIALLDESDTKSIEIAIDEMTARLPELKSFVLPGGHPAIAACHIARTVCRRAERLATALFMEEPFDENLLQYLNRLSDYFFTLSRMLCVELGVEETPWVSKRK